VGVIKGSKCEPSEKCDPSKKCDSSEEPQVPLQGSLHGLMCARARKVSSESGRLAQCVVQQVLSKSVAISTDRHQQDREMLGIIPGAKVVATEGGHSPCSTRHDPHHSQRTICTSGSLMTISPQLNFPLCISEPIFLLQEAQWPGSPCMQQPPCFASPSLLF
jgi:hypothetical protein